MERMLANRPLRAGERLPCLVVRKLPRHWRQLDSSGYIMMRFKGARTVRGQRFLGGASADKDHDFIPRGRALCDGGGSMLPSDSITFPDSPLTASCILGPGNAPKAPFSLSKGRGQPECITAAWRSLSLWDQLPALARIQRQLKER